MRSLITRFIPEALYERCMFRIGLALYLAVIVLGSIPGARSELDDYASGLVLHFFTYSVIAFLLASGTAGSTATKALKAFLIVAAMGALDEFIQSFLPYRHAAVSDWCIDLVAGLTTAMLFQMAARRKPE